MKCVRSNSVFYYQIGNGTTTISTGAHLLSNRLCLWPMVARLKAHACSKASGKTTSMTALCGAALAAMSRLYKKYDSAYASQCLEKSKSGLRLCNEHHKGNLGGTGDFTEPKKVNMNPTRVVLCMELFRATGDSNFFSEANDCSSFMTGATTWNHNYTLCYNNTEDLAYYLLAHYGGSDLAKERLTYYVNELLQTKRRIYTQCEKITVGDYCGILPIRLFVYGLYAKMNNNMVTVDPYALATIEYMMGATVRTSATSSALEKNIRCTRITETITDWITTARPLWYHLHPTINSWDIWLAELLTMENMRTTKRTTLWLKVVLTIMLVW